MGVLVREEGEGVVVLGQLEEKPPAEEPVLGGVLAVAVEKSSKLSLVESGVARVELGEPVKRLPPSYVLGGLRENLCNVTSETS